MSITVGTYEGRLFGWDLADTAPAAAASTALASAAPRTVQDWALSFAIAAHEGPVRCVAVDAHGKFLVTGGADETIRCGSCWLT